MGKFKNINKKIQVVGSGDQFDDTIQFYNKLDANAVTQLGFRADNGNVVLAKVNAAGDILSDLETFVYSDVTSPTSTGLENLIDTLNSYIDTDSSVGDAVQIGIAVTDELSNISTGTSKITFRMPFDMTLTSVRASVNTAPTGADIEVDINEEAVSILSTVISIDATEESSEDSATPPVISDTALANDAEMTIDVDQIGSTLAGAGLKIWLIGTRV